MEAPSLIFYSFYLLNSLIILCANGVNIQLYKYDNFTGLIWESNSTANCSNIPKDKQAYIYSIRTDKCFISYWDPNCTSSSSEKYMPGDITVSPNQLGRHGLIYSFHICNDEEGGNQLNVDITERHGSHLNPPKVLQSYRNICSCVNVPQYVQNMSSWSFDNHHNALLGYYEPDCSVKKLNPRFIAAGHNYDSRNIHFNLKTDQKNTTYKIQSFGPDPNSTYFQTSCNSSHVVTTERTTLVENTSESVIDVDADLDNERFEVLINQIVKLQSQVDQLKRNQDKFQNFILEKFQNLIYEIKDVLHKLFA